MKVYATTRKIKPNGVVILNLGTSFPVGNLGKDIDVYTIYITDRKSYSEINNEINKLTGSESTYIDTFLL